MPERRKRSDSDRFPRRPNPAEYESEWYARWIEGGCFSARPEADAPRFTIVIPPPNITGSLHMGHALNLCIQDALIRYRKSAGADSLWVPGTDHAGIATQNVVEKQLADEGTSRAELGREGFEKRVREWKGAAIERINDQIRKLGCAVDWTMERFTMDEQCSLAVRTAFKRLFDEGLIYRDTRIINWCPRCRTALSDIEVEHAEEEGALYYIAYPLIGDEGAVTVATTRPETMLGDSAVAVNPGDDRYRSFHGKRLLLPLVRREIPLITDDYVDMSFGTGALKITPAHDPYDFEIGRRHGLAQHRMLTEEAVITGDYPPYAGLDRYEARKRVVEDLKAAELLKKQEPYRHSVGRCYRCDTAVEPYLSLQWFVKTKPLAAPAAEAVREGKTRFLPEKWTKVYLNWLDDIRDWCISRQLWWGHRIPVWTCGSCGAVSSSVEDLAACPSCSSAALSMEEDVLDTWFSSGLWPLSTLGWPAGTRALEVYYPTTVLVTGFDIIFFWVARMMMFGLKFGGDVPFREVYIHGIVRDAKGKKMSKSFGNVIDPIDTIGVYGADALRYAFLSSAGMGQDVYISDERFKAGRNLCNKLWNSARFILMDSPGAPPLEKALEDEPPDLADRWILSRAAVLLDETKRAMDGYRIDEALHKAYAFFWHDFCDWYLESAKPKLRAGQPGRRALTAAILHRLIALNLSILHPFLPFITEELWKLLPAAEGMLAAAPCPSLSWEPDRDAEDAMSLIQDFIRSVRDIRANLNAPPSKKIEVIVLTGSGEKIQTVKAGEPYIAALAGVERISFLRRGEIAGKQTLSSLLPGMEIHVRVPEGAMKEEMRRLEKKRSALAAEMERVERKLGDENFLSRAPGEIVKKENQRFAALKEDLHKISERLNELSGR
ncbi:MAG: valine--tRNA ligase [bacterium]